MQLIIRPDGTAHCVYDEALELRQLGAVSITRGSHVEPDETGNWIVDLAPIAGPRLGPFDRRSDALAAERDWLQRHWLCQSPRVDAVWERSTGQTRPPGGSGMAAESLPGA